MIINTNQISTKSYTALLLSVFDDLQLQTDTNGLYQIPLKYGHSSRLYKKLSSPGKSITYRTPIMSLIETNNTINLERATNRLLKRKRVDTDVLNAVISYNSTPVDFLFELTIISDTLTTMSAIKEAIITKFHNNTYYVDYISAFNEVISTPIVLNEITVNVDDMESEYTGDRFIECKISLTVEGFVDNQFNSGSKIITRIDEILKDYSLKVTQLIDTYTIEA